MKRLRQDQRKKGLYAECGKNPSNTYKCDECSQNRKVQELKRMEAQLSQGLCSKCG